MDGWKQDSAYGWSHPTGWTIGRYMQSGEEIFMLWHGGETQGRFATLELAIGRHVELVPQASSSNA